MANENIEALVLAQPAHSASALAQHSLDDLHAQAREAYQQAFDQKVIQLLVLLATTGGTREGSEFVFQADYDGKPLRLRLTEDGFLTCTIGGQVVCDNTVPGREMILPGRGRWLRFCAERLHQVEAEKLSQQQRRDLIAHRDEVQILSIDL